jgi:hypothetical protein
MTRQEGPPNLFFIADAHLASSKSTMTAIKDDTPAKRGEDPSHLDQ